VLRAQVQVLRLAGAQRDVWNHADEVLRPAPYQRNIRSLELTTMAKKAIKPVFGSAEHLNSLKALHNGFRPWKVSTNKNELLSIQKRVTLKDKHEGNSRQTQICSLNDESGFGLFFLSNYNKNNTEQQ
jgi:hypothetical protein